MTKRNFLLFTLAGVMVCLCSCKQKIPSEPEGALARMGDQYLTLKEARANIPSFIIQEDSAKAFRRYIDEWIHKQLVLQEAKRLGLPQRKEVREKIQKARKEVLREALRSSVIASNKKELNITDEEARNYYQEHKSKFALDERYVKFCHLKTKSLSGARSAKSDLLHGVSWQKVARKYSLDAPEAIHESQQFWPISMAVSNIHIMNRYLKVIGQNEISPIQRVNGVYHFVQLIESRAKGKQPDPEWLVKQIKYWMKLNKQQSQFNSYVKNLYLKANSNNEIQFFNQTSPQKSQNVSSKDTLQSHSPNE